MWIGWIVPFMKIEAVSGQPASVASAKTIAAPVERALFRYMRNDATPDQTTMVHIDAAQHAAAPIDRNNRYLDRLARDGAEAFLQTALFLR